jgi:serine/threonine protein phosphatase PrpC
LQVEYADISLLGAREDNQDKAAAAVGEQAALLLAIDGMGGHADGARAAEIAQKVLVDAFWATPQPIFDPIGFLHVTIGRAHEEVVKLGSNLPLEHRPRATCAVCLVQQGSTWWAHVGDSRIYHLRNGAVLQRTRDHSHVELLLREGLITPEQVRGHPMRNFVECCLGGDPILPDMTLGPRRSVQAGDVLLVCTDGLWGSLQDEDLAAGLSGSEILRSSLPVLGKRAVVKGGAGSDNTSAAALRLMA